MATVLQCTTVHGMRWLDSIAHVPGIVVSNDHKAAESLAVCSGVTVVLCAHGCTASVMQHGGAPCTSQTDALRIENFDNTHVSAITLSGGSMIGLHGSSSGVFQQLLEHDRNDDSFRPLVFLGSTLPHVSSAAMLDLPLQDHLFDGKTTQSPSQVFNTYRAMGKSAARTALQLLARDTQSSVIVDTPSGNVGAGMGATVGKFSFNVTQTMKTGLGSAALAFQGQVVVGAVISVNAVGDIIDTDGTVLAGHLREDGITGVHARQVLYEILEQQHQESAANLDSRTSQGAPLGLGNTIIGTIATNVALNRQQLRKVNEMATQGIMETTWPSATRYDGDTLFALSTGQLGNSPDNVSDMMVTAIGAAARDVVAMAIRRGTCCARSIGAVPAAFDRHQSACAGIIDTFNNKDLCLAIPGTQGEQHEQDKLRGLTTSD